jgi:methionyl-tRNA formyltransferase
MSKQECAVLFLGKVKDWHTGRAAVFCERNFTTVRVILGDWGDPFPAGVLESRWDCIVSYLSRWIVPAELLGRATHAINFHPGPPEYPGYGCNNFAIYDGAREYGATCHHMAPEVDTGPIVAVARFPVLPTDTGGTLLLRTYDYQLVLFYDVVGRIIHGERLPAARDKWTRKPFTKRQFENLGRITPEMSQDEAARRKRATDVSVLRRAG